MLASGSGTAHPDDKTYLDTAPSAISLYSAQLDIGILPIQPRVKGVSGYISSSVTSECMLFLSICASISMKAMVRTAAAFPGSRIR